MEKKLPIRNKSKDNPYVLGYDEDKDTYTVEFADSKKVIHKVEISDKVYEAFDKFELEDVSQIHKYSKHIEHSEIYEETLEKRMVDKPITIEEEVENKILIEEVKSAINLLSGVQKKRIMLYYFENKTLKEIAKIESCSIKNVHKSIEQAIIKIKKNLKI